MPQKEKQFESSDSARSGDVLQHVRTITLSESFELENGGVLPEVTVAFETFGQLSLNRDNAVLVCHALTGDSHLARHDENDTAGWWDIVVGPGKPIDTDRYFVICPNALGGCRGTTGPNSINPTSGKPYGADFPVITVGDIARVQKLVVDHFKIEQLLAVIGGSLGGHMAMQWAVLYPEMMRGTAALATSAHLTSQALAFDVVGRNAIASDPAYHGGQYYDKETKPNAGLAIARMLGHITYLSRESMMTKFDADRLQARDIATDFETKFSVGSYLAYQGDRFGERFDANSYSSLTMAMDLFNLGETHEKRVEMLGRSKCRWLVISYTSDWLFPTFQSKQVVDALIASDKPVSYCDIESPCGHDAFLLPNQLPIYGGLLRGFLENLRDEEEETDHLTACERPSSELGVRHNSPTSIFHDPSRIDYDSLVELIPEGASVLDLGCGNGGLLNQLHRRSCSGGQQVSASTQSSSAQQQASSRRLMGVEWDEQTVLSCVERGFDVVQSDLNEGLASFNDRQFDVVVLSQTLQTVMDVGRVLDEMLRVGRRGIVSFPNLAYHAYCEELVERGRAPRIDATDGFEWHNTPNVRFLSIADFMSFCESRGIQIHERIWLDTELGKKVEEFPNRNANLAILVLSK